MFGERSYIRYSPVCFARFSHGDARLATSKYGVALTKAGYEIIALAVQSGPGKKGDILVRRVEVLLREAPR